MAFTESSVHESSLPWKKGFYIDSFKYWKTNIYLCFDDKESILEEDINESRADTDGEITPGEDVRQTRECLLCHRLDMLIQRQG